VNNAGWAYDDLCTNANLDKLHWMFNINVFSAIMLSKFVIRDFLLNNVRGSLVHISSVSTKNGFKGLSMYAATKGALEVFSMGVAREWGSIGVRSNCIAPGFMETEMSQSLDDEQRLKIYRRTALGRAVDLSSVAEMTLFLVDEEKSNSITGSVFYIDGGN
jgi:3-oxoacyl-[acyl-carrier protein] reductase